MEYDVTPEFGEARTEIEFALITSNKAPWVCELTVIAFDSLG
jgi:hypothetical protein